MANGPRLPARLLTSAGRFYGNQPNPNQNPAQRHRRDMAAFKSIAGCCISRRSTLLFESCCLPGSLRLYSAVAPAKSQHRSITCKMPSTDTIVNALGGYTTFVIPAHVFPMAFIQGKKLTIGSQL